MMYMIPLVVHKGTIICRTVIQIYFEIIRCIISCSITASIFSLRQITTMRIKGKVPDHIHGLIVLQVYSLFSLQCLASTTSSSPSVARLKY